jgi:uncharacterized cupin superfamily protein
MSTTATKAKPAARPDMKLALSFKKEAEYQPGRRAFFKYRDLGVTAGTQGRMRAQVTSAIEGMTEPTGWHTHDCDIQFVYVMKGWVDLEFEGQGAVRLAAGDSVMIPGGLAHQEVRTSDDYEFLELSTPAAIGTAPCDPPKRD